MLSNRFWLRVVNNVDIWKRRLPFVREAVFRNAIDANRADQGEWIDRYERMCGIYRDRRSGPADEAAITVAAPKKKKGA